MRKTLSLFIIIMTFVLSGCSKETTINTDTLNNALTGKPEPTYALSEEGYCFDVTLDWDAKEYEVDFGQDLYCFSAVVDSPYQYTYQCENVNMTVDEIAYELGVILMEDMMRDYEGKAFTVTEYKNLKPQVLSKEEVAEWEENYKSAWSTKPVVIGDDQWLCGYQCQFKYTGVYSGIGEMPSDMEWMETLYRDGSGEKLLFIIQRGKDNEYILRGLPKTRVVKTITLVD